MKIEFLFNEIKDMANLYCVTTVDSPLNTAVTSYDYLGQGYCQNAISATVAKLTGVEEFSYQGDFERKANEVFVITTAHCYYTVIFTIDTYEYEKARMKVSITSDEREGVTTSNNTEYDVFLERLKIELKEVLRKDWESCAWIVDEQSESLCSHLYSKIFKVENNIRAFANKVLLHRVGVGWLKQPGLEKYLNSHKGLSVEFKREVPSFANIDDTFIAMTLETMMEVITKAKIYEGTIELTEDDCQKLHQKLVFDNEANSLLTYLREKRKVKVDFWTDIFKEYFEEEKEFLQAVTNFIKNRNHVAHNKLLNLSGYQTMHQNISQLDEMVRKANTNFESSIPSEELYMTWNIEGEAQREADEQVDWERNYLRMRIESETGVKIRCEQEIFDLFCEKLDELYTEIADTYYFDSRYKVSLKFELDLEEVCSGWIFFCVWSRATEDTIDVVVDFDLDKEMGGNSSVRLSCQTAETEEELFVATIYYHNGSGYEDSFEGVIVLDDESAYDGTELDGFKQQLKDYIEEELNPLISKKSQLEYESQRRGGMQPVADFPCEECGEFGVSVWEDFYPVGRCCYCGMDNEVYACEMCGSIFGDGGGQYGICNACLLRDRD